MTDLATSASTSGSRSPSAIAVRAEVKDETVQSPETRSSAPTASRRREQLRRGSGTAPRGQEAVGRGLHLHQLGPVQADLQASTT